uniref:Uncharacterized protein n=1 Tax=Leersia perrieri TaxID=77586 RepID=A0A0D9WWM9_9ORYZ
MHSMLANLFRAISHILNAYTTLPVRYFHVNTESARVKLSLQQSMCSSLNCSFVQVFFLLDQKVTTPK